MVKAINTESSSVLLELIEDVSSMVDFPLWGLSHPTAKWNPYSQGNEATAKVVLQFSETEKSGFSAWYKSVLTSDGLY